MVVSLVIYSASTKMQRGSIFFIMNPAGSAQKV